jgi:hypothetical protein
MGSDRDMVLLSTQTRAVPLSEWYNRIRYRQWVWQLTFINHMYVQEGGPGQAEFSDWAAKHLSRSSDNHTPS